MWSHYQRTIEGIEMNKTTEALKLAEEALESCDAGDYSTGHVIPPSFNNKAVDEALAAIREALAEPVKHEPVAHYKDAPHTIYLQTGCDDPEDCECSFNEWGDTTWCADQIHDTDIPYIRADYAAPVSAEAIRAEALEEAAKVCRTAQAQGLQSIREAIEAAIRGLK